MWINFFNSCNRSDIGLQTKPYLCSASTMQDLIQFPELHFKLFVQPYFFFLIIMRYFERKKNVLDSALWLVSCGVWGMQSWSAVCLRGCLWSSLGNELGELEPLVQDVQAHFWLRNCSPLLWACLIWTSDAELSQAPLLVFHFDVF